MQVNVNTGNRDWTFAIANKYLPVRLSTTFFYGFGDCIAIVANRAEGMLVDFTENNKSEIFISLMNNQLYDNIKAKVLNMDFWFPPAHYYTCDGIADGQQRKIHLDGLVF